MSHTTPARASDAWARPLLFAALVFALACGDNFESVSRDVCVSGLRWTGGNSRDVEMAPGSDCLGCHLEYDGPPLIAAGTVYATADNVSQIENDCYGLEGVEVELEGADGKLLSTTTNRAGNFYFDGDPRVLPKPYIARLRYTTPEGRLVSPQMVVTQPYNGSCGHCHDPRKPATLDLDSRDPELVLPVDGLFVQ